MDSGQIECGEKALGESSHHSKQLYHFEFPQEYLSISCFKFSPIFDIASFVFDWHTNKCVVAFHSGVNLHFLND